MEPSAHCTTTLGEAYTPYKGRLGPVASELAGRNGVRELEILYSIIGL